jgi:hypothetical protein
MTFWTDAQADGAPPVTSAEPPHPPSEYACLECHAEPGEPHAETCDDAGSIVRSVAEQDGSETAAAAAGPLVCRVPTQAEQRRFTEEFPNFVTPFPRAPNFEELGAPPDDKRCTSVCAEALLALGERCMLGVGVVHEGERHRSGGVEWNLDVALVERIAREWLDAFAGRDQPVDRQAREAVRGVLVGDPEQLASWTDEAIAAIRTIAARLGYQPHPTSTATAAPPSVRGKKKKCTECSAKPGKLHVEGCSQWPLTVPSVDGEREDGSKKIKRADGRQTQRGICSELALRAIQSGNLDGARAWIVKLEFFGDTERVRGLKVILEREEQQRAARKKTAEPAPAPDGPGPLPPLHPARVSKRAKALIGHAEGAIAAGNYDSAAEAIDELDGISSGAVTAEHTHDAAERLRVYGAHMKATHGEAPPPRARRAAATTTKAPAAAGPPKKKRIKVVVKGDDGSEREVDGAGA